MVGYRSITFSIKEDWMKIAIIGYSGSGKSTLAKQLAQAYEISVLYMDQVHWLPHWHERTHEQELEILKQFLSEHSDWVIDGNYYKLLFDQRMDQADQIIVMSFDRFSCLWRAMKRYFQNKGKTRESMSTDCEEKMDLEFIKWIIKDGRSKSIKRRNEEVIHTYATKVIVIKNQMQLNRYVSSVLNHRSK